MSCTTILVGKKASYDGSTIIARNDDGGYDVKRLEVVIPKKRPSKYKCVISHLEIDLPDNPLKYTICPNVDKKDGIWGAFGINELNVGMTATETISSNVRVISHDPYVRYKKSEDESKDKDKNNEIVGGIGEEDIISLVLPYISSAREGVVRLGSLLEKYGTYEANGLAISDENEIWWLETIGGHHWIAKRVPDDRVVIMPNQFGLDEFDFSDAYSEKKENMCSEDLKDFMVKNHIDCNLTSTFNPRLAFGSHTYQDHIYNTPRAWFMLRYLNPREYTYDGDNAYFKPDSDDIPWSFVPSRKISIEEIKYILSSYYQGTPYNPYSKSSEKGKYRSIGVPNTDDAGIIQIRGYLLPEIKGLIYVSLGGGVFTSSIAEYANVSNFPSFLSTTPLDVSCDHFFWISRLIAALTDANYVKTIALIERYQYQSLLKSFEAIHKSDAEFIKTKDIEILNKTNESICSEAKKDSLDVLKKVLNIASDSMKTRYNRSDN
ncbi:C69 family dipeptidase [bacterium]|nr:C69 family dipeptidase [bacterium]